MLQGRAQHGSGKFVRQIADSIAGSPADMRVVSAPMRLSSFHCACTLGQLSSHVWADGISGHTGLDLPQQSVHFFVLSHRAALACRVTQRVLSQLRCWW